MSTSALGRNVSKLTLQPARLAERAVVDVVVGDAQEIPSGPESRWSYRPKKHRAANSVHKTLDDIDIRIVVELQRDGRVTFQKLSDIVGLSRRACMQRVRRLEREHFIIGYTARLDLRRLADFVVVVAQICLRQGREARCRFEQRIRSCPEVLECLAVGGTFDYIVKVVSQSLSAYQELKDAWIDDPAMHVERIESNIVLQSPKEIAVYPITVATTLGVLTKR